jgi:hypothetical protein
LVLDGSGAIATITSLTATNIYGSNKTGSQTSITSVGALSGLTIDGNLTFTGASRTITGLNSISATTLTGTLSTAAQTAITSVGALNGLTIDGNLTFTGASRSITGLNSISATDINATTYKQSGTTYDLSLVNRLALTTLGSAEASKALVLDSTSSARGVATMEINQTATLSTSSSMDAFGLILRRNSATIGDTAGIALGTTNVSSISTTTGGASIIFTRTGAQGIGTLSLNIRTSSATGMTPLSEVLKFHADGSSTFAYPVSFSNNVSISGIANLGSIQIGGTEITTSGRHIQNVGDITCSGTMNSFFGYNVNGSTFTDSSRNVFAASVIADYAQLAKAAGALYASTLLTNQYNLALSNSSNLSATFSGLAFHIDTAPLSGATPGACIISERNSTTAYDGSSISFCTKGTAGSANALLKRMTIPKTGSINLGDGVSTDGDLLLIKSAGSPLFRFGTALSTKNCISLQWNYSGSGLDTNRLSFDIYGSSNTLCLTANSRVCVGGSGPTSRFHVVGSTDNKYGDWLRLQEWWNTKAYPIQAGLIIYDEDGGSNTNGISFGTYTNDPIHFMVNGTNGMQFNTLND